MFVLFYAVMFICVGYALNRYIDNKTVVFSLFAGITVLWFFSMGPWALATLIELIIGYSLVDKPKKSIVSDFKLSDIPNGIKNRVVNQFDEAAKEKSKNRESDAGINMVLCVAGFVSCLFLVNQFNDDEGAAVFSALAMLCVLVFTVFAFVYNGKQNAFTNVFFRIWDTIRYLIAFGLVGLLIYAFASN